MIMFLNMKHTDRGKYAHHLPTKDLLTKSSALSEQRVRRCNILPMPKTFSMAKKEDKAVQNIGTK
jgi:hypothetical protein